MKDDASSRKREHLNAEEKREKKAADVQLFAKQYGRAAQRALRLTIGPTLVKWSGG